MRKGVEGDVRAEQVRVHPLLLSAAQRVLLIVLFVLCQLLLLLREDIAESQWLQVEWFGCLVLSPSQYRLDLVRAIFVVVLPITAVRLFRACRLDLNAERVGLA